MASKIEFFCPSCGSWANHKKTLILGVCGLVPILKLLSAKVAVARSQFGKIRERRLLDEIR